MAWLRDAAAPHMPPTAAYPGRLLPRRADFLPVAARRRLAELLQASEEDDAARVVVRGQLSTARTALATAVARKAELESPYRSYADVAAARRENERDIEEHREAVALLAERLSAIEARCMPRAQLLRGLREYLARLTAPVGARDRGVDDELGDGESFVSAIDKCRLRYRELVSLRREKATAPRMASDVRRDARDELERLADRGEAEPVRWG
jgi:hypothetical protein